MRIRVVGRTYAGGAFLNFFDFLDYTYWRASEASETLFSHVDGNSRYIYVYMYAVSNTHVRVNVFFAN